MLLSPLRISSWSTGLRVLNRKASSNSSCGPFSVSTPMTIVPHLSSFYPSSSSSSSSSPFHLSGTSHDFLFAQQQRFQSTSSLRLLIRNGRSSTTITTTLQFDPSTLLPEYIALVTNRTSLKCLRAYISSSSSPVVVEPQPVSPPPTPSPSSNLGGLVTEVKSLIGAYMIGVKGLYTDWKESQVIQQQKTKPRLFETIDSNTLRLLSLEEREEGTMTWRELLKVHKAKANLLKSLPVVSLFCLPIIGNTVPIITYFFPWLLPNSFLTDSQKTALASSIRQQQIEFSKQVVEDLRTMPELYDHPVFSSFIAAVEQLASTTPSTPSGSPPIPSELTSSTSGSASISNSTLLRYFERGLELIVGLPGLTRSHLNSLANCFPYAATRFHIYPSALYRRNLIRTAALLYEEDVVLTRDPIALPRLLSEELTLEELQELCESRAIHVADFEDRKQLEEGLKEWLEFVSNFDQLLFSSTTSQQPQRISFPVSFYLHSAVLKNLLPSSSSSSSASSS